MFKKSIKISLYLLIFSFVFFLLADLTLAQQQTLDEKDIVKPGPQIKIPGLDFSDPKIKGGDLVIPFIGDYISAVYRWAVVAASILAILVIIVSGIQWIISRGKAETISSAKDRIQGAITGLLVVLGSYIILWTINPNLVKFEGLRIKYIEAEPPAAGHDEPSESEKNPVSGSNITKRTPRLDDPSNYCFPLAQDSFKQNLNNWGDDRSGGERCHAGIDLLTNDDQEKGTVVAIADGKVTVVGRSWLKCQDGATVPEGEKKQTGNIMIYHPELDMTVNYTEVDVDHINVENGQEVEKGQVIGRATYCEMLHFELYKGNEWKNVRWHPPEGESSLGDNKCAKEYISQIKDTNLLNPTGVIKDLSGNYCK